MCNAPRLQRERYDSPRPHGRAYRSNIPSLALGDRMTKRQRVASIYTKKEKTESNRSQGTTAVLVNHEPLPRKRGRPFVW